MKTTYTSTGGNVASRRIQRELRAALADFQQRAGQDEPEFLLQVLEDALDLRGTGPDGGLMCIQTAFNQNLKRSQARFVRVEPERLPDVLEFIRWQRTVEGAK